MENGKQIEDVSSKKLEKIKSQIEYYFGDVNMERDKFLIEQTKLDEGWVPMEIMLKFKMLAALSRDIPTILKSIETSDLIEISEDTKKIRRRLDKPLPTYDIEHRKSQTARTVHIRGFPLKDIETEDLLEFFKDLEPVETIFMKKHRTGRNELQFNGSITVQFKTVEDTKAFMARKSVKYGDAELIRTVY